MIKNTKDEIKNRMLRKAAEMWEVSPTDIDSSFDPVISLLIGACASEISEIISDRNSSHARVADNLINLMTPEASSGVTPSHAIAHATPTEPNVLLKKNFQFYSKKKITDYKGDISYKTAYFSSACDFPLIDTYLKYAIIDDALIEFNEDSKRYTSTYIKNASSDLKSTTVLLGFPKTEEKISLKGISIYLDLEDVSNKDLFYSQFKNLNIKYNDESIPFQVGIKTKLNQEKKYLSDVFSHQSSKTISSEKLVMDFYNKRYITLNKNIFLNAETKENHNKWSNFIATDDAPSDIHWLELEFPSVIDLNTLKSLRPTINSFPILNRKLESISYGLKDYSKIVPIGIQDTFLDIDSITNENGQKYTSIEKGDDSQKGTFFLKLDHIGRLDSGKAKDYLEQLIDLLKNESAAFSIFGNDFLNDMVSKLSQDISLLENKIDAIDLNKIENKYIEVHPFKEKETIFVDYWTTIGEIANNIKANSPIFVYKGADINPKNCFLVTTSLGGKDKLSTQEKIYKYRRAVLSQDRVVTIQDVKALCYDIAGNMISNVEIEKKFLVGNSEYEGRIPNMVITLYKKKGSNRSQQEWELISSNILSILEEKSHNILPYKIELIE